MLKNFLKTAARNFGKQRMTSLINVSGLAIGMTAAILIFLWIRNELSFDNYHKDSQNIYRIKSYIGLGKKDVSIWENSPYYFGEKAIETVPEVIAMTRLQPRIYNPPFFNVKGEFIKEEACAYVDSSWFDVFRYDVIKGSIAAFNKDPFGLVLASSKAKKYFGNEEPIGRIIRVDTINYTVHAVVKDNRPNSSFQYDVFFTVEGWLSNPRNKKNAESWGNYSFLTFLKLLPDSDPGKVEAKLTTIIRKERDKDDFAAGLTPLGDMHFEKEVDSSSIQKGDGKMVKIFVVLGVLLLAIACINYVNLTTARASVRIKEVSIKKIVGARRAQLFAQFVLESALVSFISLLIALLALYLALPYFNMFTGRNFNIEEQSGWIATIFLGTFVCSVALTSIYPAIVLSSFKPLSVFRGYSVFQIKDGALRRALVVLQFTISIVLIIGTIVIYRQMQFIQQQSSSFNKSQIFSFTIPFKILRNYEGEKRTGLTSSIKQELLSHSSIENVTLANTGSLINMQGWSSGNSNDWEGRDPDFQPPIAFFEADTSLKSMLHLQLESGRWFLAGSEADKHNSILNETAVKEFGLKLPAIGQRFTSQGDTGVVIGVVKDFYYKSMHEKIGPVVIRNDQSYSGTYFVKTIPGKTMAAKEAAVGIWKKFFPAEPFSYQFMNEEFETMYRSDQKASILVWVFSILAIVISCMGLYGLASFTAERRSKEIGIRKVLGAGVTSIVSLIAMDFLKLVLLALVLATPLAWLAMNNWLQDFAYRVNIGWWIFITAGAIAIVIAFASIGFRAMRAAAANPVKSLRTE
jgi:ABC-type antimicrobial peptide transport system permease subunit